MIEFREETYELHGVHYFYDGEENKLKLELRKIGGDHIYILKLSLEDLTHINCYLLKKFAVLDIDKK